MQALITAFSYMSPMTGEQKSMWPWFVGGIGLLALAAFAVLTVLEKKKNAGGAPSADETSTESTEDNASVNTPDQETDATENEQDPQ